jgi:hypothetical protein
VSDPGSATVDVGTPAAGDVFEARIVDDGGTVVTTARTPAWNAPITLAHAR